MRGGEDEAKLIGDVVSGQGTAHGAFFEHDPIMHGGDGGGRGADIDHEGGRFACGEAEGILAW